MRSLVAVTAVLAGTAGSALAMTGGTVALAAARHGVAAAAATPRARHATAAFSWHRLKLLDGWKSASTHAISTGTPSYAIRDGVVYLNGEIKQPVSGSETFARLPAGSRPAHTLWIQVLTGTTDVPGTLRVYPDGAMAAYRGVATSETSLAMVSFPTARIKSHALPIGSGWESGQSAYSGGNPAYAISHGVVYLSGSLVGTEADPQAIALTLPRAARPKHAMFLTVYTYFGSTGTLLIEPTGKLEVFGSEASSFTSLAGLSYPVASTRWHALVLQSTWIPSTLPAGVGHPAYAVVNGVVFLTGGAQQITAGSIVFAQMPRSARSKHELSALTYASDEQWAGVTSFGRYLFAFSQPPSVSETFTSLAGLSYPIGA
jgi:hypothetical protein